MKTSVYQMVCLFICLSIGNLIGWYILDQNTEMICIIMTSYAVALFTLWICIKKDIFRGDK